MGKVYAGALMVDEIELAYIIDAVIHNICRYNMPCIELDDQIELYTKLLTLRKEIQHERCKLESKPAESV